MVLNAEQLAWVEIVVSLPAADPNWRASFTIIEEEHEIKIGEEINEDPIIEKDLEVEMA